MVIGDRQVGPGHPCLVIAEVAQAHDGSLGDAHAYIDAIADAGADAVKFQCHLGDPTDRWRVPPVWPQDEDRQAYWRRTGFTAQEWAGLARHASEVGLLFLCSPFSVAAVEMLDPLVPAWKVPSGRITDEALLDAIAGTSKPVILSGGMSTGDEVWSAYVRVLQQANRFPTIARHPGIARLLCTSMYPTPADRIGLDAIKDGCEVCGQDGGYYGISDHSGTIWPAVGAVARGASIVEVHVCWSKQQHGFDTSSSITVADLARLVEGVRFIEAALTPVDKDALAVELEETRRLFMGQRRVEHMDPNRMTRWE